MAATISGSKEGVPASRTNPLPVANVFDYSSYQMNDLDEASDTITYVGKVKDDGTWLVVKIDSTSGLSMRYANNSNNQSTTSYSTAWTNRASLSYSLFHEIEGF